MAPKPASGNKRLLTIILLCAVAAGAFWMFRDTARELTSPPPPPVEQGQMRLQLPTQAVTNSTGNATVSVTGGTALQQPPIDAPAAASSAPAALETATTSGPTASGDQNLGRVMPKVVDDSVITIHFIDDLARYLADSYHPAGSGPAKGDTGIVVAGTKMLNMHYGVELTGLTWSGDDIGKGRQSVLRYVLNPTMAEALYKLYADRFMAALQAEAKQLVRNVEGEERKLTRMEIKEMHHLLSVKVQATAGVLRACVLMEDAMPRVEALHTATRKALDANQKFQVTLHQYQESTEAAPKDAKAISKAKVSMDAAGKTYQQAIIQRERTRESLANALRKYKWVAMQDDGTNIYIAQWVYRRLQDNPRAFPAIMTLHEDLLDLAERMEKKAAL